MTAQTFTSAKARTGALAPFNSGGNANGVLAQYISYTIPETPEVNDIYKLFALPKGAVPVFGYLGLTDVDTGTETLDIDLGYAGNGVDVADPDAYVNAGVLTGDTITDFPFTNLANLRLITPAAFTGLGAKTTVQAVVNAVAQAGGTGTLVAVIFYVTPGSATS